MGCRVGRRRIARRDRLARRVPDSLFAVALPSRHDDVRVRRDPRDRTPERDRHLAAAREERERVRLVVRRPDEPARERLAETARGRSLRGGAGDDESAGWGESADRPHGSAGQRGRRSEVCGAPGDDADRDGQSRLRSGRGGPRRREPERLRNVLLRAPPVLRRRQRHVPVRRGLQRRPVQRPVLPAADRPRAARRARAARRRLRIGARPDDDSGGREAHGTRGQILDRRDERVDRRRESDHRARNVPDDAVRGAADELFGRARAPRVRESVHARLHRDVHEPPPRGRHVVPSGQCVYRRRRLGLASVETVRDPGVLGGKLGAGQRGGD